MTTNLLHGKGGDASSPDARMGLAIGEFDSHVFNCPACSRPLAEGESRCPGCGTRLIMGVMVKRAGAILGLGMVLGVLVGGVTTASAITVSLALSPAAEAVTPSGAPAAIASAAPPPVVGAPALIVPPAALSALSGTAVVNGRIAVDAATLSSTLAKSGVTSIEIARALRSLAADAALGIDQTGRLASWVEARPVMAELDAFYGAMADTARAALRASFTDTAGYRKAGARMLKVLASLGKVDASSRALATTLDLELPPVVLPGAEAPVATATSPLPSATP